QLKADDWMEWVRRANSIQSRAEEIVYNDLIYK
ncbi:MAG: TnpV protein, partial [Clostridia bacterium]|nr:TnpV protein [Clostridia bacterium]